MSRPYAHNPMSSVWGSVQRAVQDPTLRQTPGGITQFVWQAYKQSYLAQNRVPPRATIQDAGQLVSLAAAQFNAQRTLQAAVDRYQSQGRDANVEARFIAPDIDSRAAGTRPAGPLYRVRFNAEFMVEGLTRYRTITWDATNILPHTVAELLGTVDEIGLGAADDYGESYSGNVTGLTILQL